MGKGKNDIRDAWRDYKFNFEDTGNKIPKTLFQPNKIVVLGRNLRSRLTHHLVRRCSLAQLDKAVEFKTGKKSTKSEQSRRVAQAYDEGVMDTIENFKKELSL